MRGRPGNCDGYRRLSLPAFEVPQKARSFVHASADPTQSQRTADASPTRPYPEAVRAARGALFDGIRGRLFPLPRAFRDILLLFGAQLIGRRIRFIMLRHRKAQALDNFLMLRLSG